MPFFMRMSIYCMLNFILLMGMVDEEMIVDPGEVKNEEEEEDPEELVYFSYEDEVSFDMGTDADD